MTSYMVLPNLVPALISPNPLDSVIGVDTEGLLMWRLIALGAAVLFLVGMLCHDNRMYRSPLPFLLGMALSVVSLVVFCIAVALTFDRTPTTGQMVGTVFLIIMFAAVAGVIVQTQVGAGSIGWWVFGILTGFALISIFDELTSRVASGFGLSQGMVVLGIIGAVAVVGAQMMKRR